MTMDEKVEGKGLRFYARVYFGILPPLNCSPRPSIPPLRTQNKPSLAFSFGRTERRGREGERGAKKGAGTASRNDGNAQLSRSW